LPRQRPHHGALSFYTVKAPAINSCGSLIVFTSGTGSFGCTTLLEKTSSL
jgi:hypothetical protein